MTTIFNPTSFSMNLSGDITQLHNGLAALGFKIPTDEIRNAIAGTGTRKAVASFQKERGLEASGIVDLVTSNALRAAIDQTSYIVEGRVASPDRAALSGLTVEIVDHSLTGDTKLGEAITDAGGNYSVRFIPSALRAQKGGRPDLCARVLAEKALVGTSQVLYNAGSRTTLNVPLPPGAALPSEHETLTSTLAPHVPGALADLKESDDRQDITYLANKTGWDARAVAFAALADQLARLFVTQGSVAMSIKAPFYYALLRAGLPANPQTIFRIAPETAQDIWSRAIKAGVIQADLAKDLPAAVAAFRVFAASHTLNTPALTGASALKDLIKRAIPEPEKQQQVADLLVRYRHDDNAFWAAITKSFGSETGARLKVDAELSHLTVNNAALIDRLHQADNQPVGTTADLAMRGYFRADRWAPLIKEVPGVIPGDTDAKRRANYAELLAAQIRISFPTAVVASNVASGAVPIAGGADVRKQVAAFLVTHQSKFEIGMQAIDQYLQRNALSSAIPLSVKQELKRLQRAYQITPDDRSLVTLLAHDLHSAYQVVRYDEPEFVSTFAKEMGGAGTAKMVHAKARQVHAAVLNLATSYLLARRGIPIGVHSPPAVVDPVPVPAHASDVVAYATLESLFGSMDFCACEQCRSILSPAAYLVDLLQFIDRPVNATGNAQAVLLERRPDIATLPLTCENTNTPLPHIDLVNETLEYYITNGLSLAGYAGHTTDDNAAQDELAANPQFTNDAAYDTLKNPANISDLFPPPLPFHRSLEALRRYLSGVEVPLRDAMETLRVDDAVDRTAAASYGWRDTLMEWVGLSRVEYTLLTDSTISVKDLYGYSAGAATNDVMNELSGFKVFARRIGITYQELTALLQTRFVNPACSLIAKLERLHVPFATIAALKNNTITSSDFDALLPAGLDATEYGASTGNAPAAVRAWITNQANYDRIMSLIVVANPTHPGDMASIDELELRYANPDNSGNKLQRIDFVRLLRFVRLWRKLGWTIEQTDLAIEALYPTPQLPTGVDEAADLVRLDTGFGTLIPRLGIIVQVIDRLNLTPKKGLDGLLVCFGPIGVHAKEALYRKMFMGAAPPAQDPAFADDGYGNVLGTPTETLFSHTETLRGAFSLSGAEFAQIVAALGFNGNTVLTLNNISAIYRRGWLARALRISTRELLELTRRTGLDPFTAPDPPNPPIIGLLHLIEALRGASVKPMTALFLMWNQDLTGNSTPDDARIADFIRQLRSGFAAVESSFAAVDDPTGEIARARMTLVYGSEVTDFFFGLINDGLISDTPFANTGQTLLPAIVNVAGSRLAYDELRKRLAYTGVLSGATRDAIKSAGAPVLGFAAAMDALYAVNQNAVGAFFARFPELESLYESYLASALPAEAKRTALLANFLPELKRRRKRSHALLTASTVSRASAEITQAVLDDVAALHGIGYSAVAAVDDLTAMEIPGLSVNYFWRSTATGQPDAAGGDGEAVLDYTAAGPVQLPASPTSAPISAIWAGYLEVPESGFFNFAIEAEAGSTVQLSLGGINRPLAQAGTTWSNTAPIELAAGSLVQITLTVEQVTTRLAVRWESAGRGWKVIPGAALYPAVLAERVRRILITLLKSTSIADALKLTATELSHLASNADYLVLGEPWMNALATSGNPTAVAAKQLCDVLRGILDFSRLKKLLSPDDERLLEVLRNPALTLANGDLALLTLTGWIGTSLDALLLRFGGLPRTQLAHVALFARVYDAYQLVDKAGVPASALIAGTTNDPSAATVSGLLSALRARYDRNDWLQALTPINDELRILQRDALVAYILRRMAANAASAHIDTPDKLFEYFLMDVQMQPCMQTTRILHATGSIQLFIDRCLMNLEPRVAPSSLDAAQWSWMKRYRVWEANRKVFLWPENWLEPELRDDQSPFFKEVMGELLQSDITEDSAALALQNYLARLEEVAKLEPCGVCQAEGSPAAADETVHVIARTAGAHRKYFYRRQDNGLTWGPWGQIKLDIEDNPVIPVVWGNRLFVFWLRILTRPPMDPDTQAASTSQDAAKPNVSDMTLADVKNEARKEAKGEARSIVEAILCWSEYFNGKWQAVRTSNTNLPVKLGFYAPDQRSSLAFDRSRLTLSSSLRTGSLKITINGSNWGSPWFLLYNTHSVPVRSEDWPATSEVFVGKWRTMDTTGDLLSATYVNTFAYHNSQSILRNKFDIKGDGVVDPTHDLNEPWIAPFLYHDHRHVYYITSSDEWVTLTRTKWVDGGGDTGMLDYRLPQMVYAPYQVIKPPLPDPPDPLIDVKTGASIDDTRALVNLNTNPNIAVGIGSSSVVRFNGRLITFDRSLPAEKGGIGEGGIPQ